MLLVEFRGEKSQAKTAEIETYTHFRTLHEMLPGCFADALCAMPRTTTSRQFAVSVLSKKVDRKSPEGNNSAAAK